MGKNISDLNRSELERRIDEQVICCPKCARNRQILKRRLFDGLTIEELAEEFELSERQINNIIERGKECIFPDLFLCN